VLGHLETSKDIDGEPVDDRIVLVPGRKWLMVHDLLKQGKTKGRWDQPQALSLLMSCGTAAIEPATLNGFVIALTSVGASAVVGTECLTFSGLAARFAEEVTIQLWAKEAKPMTLGNAVKEFRRNLTTSWNPLAFVFSAYGAADLTVT
jgi:hypothetical protein